MSKIDTAFSMFQANPTISRKDFIAKLVSELGMSAAAASTYHNTCKKRYEAMPKDKAEPVVIENVKPVAETPKRSWRDDRVPDSEIPEFLRRSWNRLGF